MSQLQSPRGTARPAGKDAWWRRRRPGRMQVGLSSAAIASVYAVGYAQTQVAQPAAMQAFAVEPTTEGVLRHRMLRHPASSPVLPVTGS